MMRIVPQLRILLGLSGILNGCDWVIVTADEVCELYHDDDCDGFSACPSGVPEIASLRCDCDDSNPSIQPDAVEECDGIDGDCSGVVDDNLPPDVEAPAWYLDGDSDGYGDSGNVIKQCGNPERYSANAGDCDDTDDQTYPDATEICDQADNDCDGDFDEELEPISIYTDDDSDGYGANATPVSACMVFDGYSNTAGDCDDAAPQTYPGSSETPYNGIDEDCSGADLTDVDGDGYDGESVGGTDCDDNNEQTYPRAADVCGDDQDNDCDDSRCWSGVVGLESDRCKLTGDIAADRFGNAVSIVGDFDRDTNGEMEEIWLAVGAPGIGDDFELAENGAVFLERDLPDDCWKDSLSVPISDTYDVKVIGQVGMGLGYAVGASIGVGASGEPAVAMGGPASSFSAGSTYLLYGHQIESPIVYDFDDDPLMEIAGTAGYQRLGSSLAFLGGINNDTYSDLLVGAPDYDTDDTDVGAAFLFFSPITADITLEQANVGFYGEAADYRSGHAVSAAGDFNGDGALDLLIGAPGPPPDDSAKSSSSFSGIAYLLLGPFEDGSRIDLTSLGEESGTTGVKIFGENGYDQTGHSLTVLDADVSPSDLIIGSMHASSVEAGDVGKVYLIRGSSYASIEPSLMLSGLDTSVHTIFEGGVSGEYLTMALASGADVNGDGENDIAIGAPHCSCRQQDITTETTPGGSVYLLFGPFSPGIYKLDPSNPDLRMARFMGEDYGDALGCSLAMGDLDGDGYAELVMGANFADVGDERNAGAVYIVRGGK